MDKKQIHELAIAYAQARLIRKQQDAETPPTEDELYILPMIINLHWNVLKRCSGNILNFNF